jgi:hypothetical protein
LTGELLDNPVELQSSVLVQFANIEQNLPPVLLFTLCASLN